MTHEGRYIGIDFGTSTIFVTQWDFKKKEARAVENISRSSHGGNPFIDNVIYYESRINPVIGASAFKRGLNDPLNMVEGVKRKMGDDNWSSMVACFGEALSAEAIASDMFRVLKNRIEEIYGGEPVNGAVISVPFAFNSKERARIKRAAETAGLKVLNLIEEPVAAALCFGLMDKNRSSVEKETALVFDLGGGTLDVALFELSCSGEGIRRLEVINTDGDKHLGGKDIDEMLIKKFQRELGYEIALIPDPRQRGKDLLKLIKAAREFKENLSYHGESDVFCSDLHEGRILAMDIEVDDFNKWLRGHGFVGQIREVLENVLAEAGIEPEDVNRVVLVGGSSNIPLVQHELYEFFGKTIESPINPAEMVGLGAGIFCGSLLEKDLSFEIIPKLSHSVGVKLNRQFVPLLNRNTCYQQPSDIKSLFIETRADRWPRMEIFQGNSSDIDECTSIGIIELDPMKIGNNIVGLQLEADSNGIINYRLFRNHESPAFDQGQL